MPSIPTKPTEYSGNQLLASSGRVTIDAKRDHLLLSAYKTIYAGGRLAINLASEKIVSIYSPKTYIGQENYEPAIRGDKQFNFDQLIIDELAALAQALKLASGTAPGVPIPSLSVAGTRLEATVARMRTELEKTRSENVWVQ